MSKEYTVTYRSENVYEEWVDDAYWQFLILPLENSTQELVEKDFSNSIHAINQYSINGFGFNSIKVHPKKRFKEISFEATFKVLKLESEEIKEFSKTEIKKSIEEINTLEFKINFERFLKSTRLTLLPKLETPLFQFNTNTSLLENLKLLNNWIHGFLKYNAGVTDITTTLDKVLFQKSGVCQDFAHLFCAVCRKNGIPARYVSGYLNHESGYLGDSQMHAWTEAYLPNYGWLGFDPTNNILANANHIKVSHGKDYNDCSPLKGVVYSHGNHKTGHSVVVKSNQQQIQQ